MRNSTRLRFFLAAASVTSLAAIFVAACGDDDNNSDLTTPDSGFDANKPDTGGGTDTGAPDTGKADTGPGDSGPVYDAGAPTTLEAGPEYDGSINCVVGGQIEQEINDTPDAANQLRPGDAGCTGTGCSRCGVIFDSDPDAGPDSGDGGLGGTEVEFVTFMLQSATKSYYLQYSGNITLIVTAEGDNNQYVINSTSSPTLPYYAGKNYFVEVRSNTGAQTPWRVTLFENQ
jgi:hypothetical protein